MPRCKHCKEKFEAIHFNQKYCTNEECLKVWVEKVKEVQWKKRKQRMKKDLKTTSDYIKECQKWVNKYVRLRDQEQGCISCGTPLVGKYDAGHFFSAGGHGSVRFDEDNIHAQCVYCNQYEHGNLFYYHKNLITKIGIENFKRLELKSNKIKKYTKDELRVIIKTYKEKCAKLQKN
ncbi:MAG: putative protein ninG [Prokaryotic dsDNA virus sp.]|nr:MAG: putative protein ninG [Prokaryotic dsDNA virus sp.]|tara:strand:+ start:4521 stop:5048 length:528 start_codon:yes stop_codon:yes gene_type:complete